MQEPGEEIIFLAITVCKIKASNSGRVLLSCVLVLICCPIKTH